MNCLNAREGSTPLHYRKAIPEPMPPGPAGQYHPSKLLRALWFIGIFILSCHAGSLAQQVQANTGAPATPFHVANEARVVTVTILQGPVPSGTLNITLPTGYVYVAGSATATSGGFSVSESSVSGNTATISLSGISSSANSTFTYLARAMCDVVEAEGESSSASYVLTLAGGSAQPAQTSNPFNAEYAKFNLLLTSNGSYTGLAGDTYNRTYTITNGGFGSIDTVYIDSRNGNGLTLNSLASSSGTVTLISATPAGNDIISRYRIININDGHFDKDETITITENLTIASCSNLAGNIEAWYGPSGNKCTGGDANGTTTAGAGIDNSKQPVMQLTPLAQYTNCFGQVSTEKFRLTNTGTAAMQNVRVNLWGSQTVTPFQAGVTGTLQSGYGTITYSVNGGPATPATIEEAENYTTPHASLAGYPGRKLFSIPEIAPGDVVEITYEIKSVDFGTGCSNRGIPRDLATWSFENPCGAVTSSPGIISLKNPINVQTLAVVADTPSDLYEGQTYSIGFDLNGVYAPGAFNNGGALVYTIGLPAQVVFSGNVGDYVATHPDLAGLDAPSSFTHDPVTNTITIIYEFPSSSAVQLERHNGLKIRLNNLTLDCSRPAAPSPAFTASVSARQAGCSAEHKLRCESYAALIHCGDCDRGGFIPTAGLVQRLNYGLPDNDLDSRPDAGGAIDMEKVAAQQVIHGDTLMMRFSGRIITNAGTPIFTKGYADVTFAGAPNDWLQGITPLNARLEVWQGGTMVGAQDGLAVTSPSAATRRLDFSISQLSSFPTGYTAFSNNDSLVVTLRYRYVQPGHPFGGYSVDYAITSVNRIYVSDVADPAAEADKWYCDLLGGNVNWAGLYMTHNTTTSAAHTGCNEVTLTNDNHLGVGLQGYAYSERFPYEYRPVSFFDTIRVNVPDHYEFVGFTATEIVSAGYYITTNRTTNLAPLDPNARPLVFALTQQYDINGGPWHLADEGHQIIYSLVLRPTCETEAGNKPFQFFKRQQESEHFNNVFPWTMHNTLPGTLGNLSYSKPNIVLTASNAEVTVASPGVSWEVQVANTTTYAASNVWLAEDAGDNGITITSVEILSGPNGTVTGTVPVVNGIYQLGDFTGVGNKYYRVNAAYTRCGRDEINLAYGYDCTAYPGNVNSTTCKQAVPLAVIPLTAAVQLTIVSQPSASVKHDLCAELPYEVQILNPSLGNVTEAGLRIKLPAMGGLVLVSGSLEINTGAGWQAISGTTAGGYITVDIPSGILPELGGSETVNIRFRLKTDGCEFVSGSTVTFQAMGKSPCGSNIIGTPQRTNKINITGSADNTNTYTITSSVTDADACEPNALAYEFSAVNNGPLPTYDGEKLFITIPAPYSLGTVTGGSNWSGFGAPTSAPAAGGTTYTWEIPTGIASGQTISFTATLTAPAADVTALGCDSLQISELIAYTFEALCVPDGPTCSGALQAEGDNDATKIPVLKPSYEVTGFTAGIDNGNITGTVTINRTNDVARNNAATISVYHDLNGNGVIDGADVLLGTDDVAITDSPNPQTLNYTIEAASARRRSVR